LKWNRLLVVADDAHKYSPKVIHYVRDKNLVGTVYSVMKPSVGYVVAVVESKSTVTRFQSASDVAVSAVKGVGELNTLYAKVTFVVNIVVPLFISKVVVQLVAATVQTRTSAPITLQGSKAILLCIQSVVAAQSVPATANCRFSKALPAYFTVAKFPAQVMIVSQITVTVVLGAQ
jgi:hypothetical protein